MSSAWQVRRILIGLALLGNPPLLVLDSSRFRAATGWSPALPLARSLSDTLDFWRQIVNKDRRPPD